jgi:hypothetical protein
MKKEDYKVQNPLQNQSVSNKPTMIGPFNSHIQYNETGPQHPLQQDNGVELQDDSTVHHQYQNMYRDIPGRSKVTDVSESPRSEVLDARDKHSDKKYALPDFQLMDEDGPMDVDCLIASTVDERASTYDQITKSKDRDKWMKAMEDEIKSVKTQNTLELTKLPEGKKAIGNR